MSRRLKKVVLLNWSVGAAYFLAVILFPALHVAGLLLPDIHNHAHARTVERAANILTHRPGAEERDDGSHECPICQFVKTLSCLNVQQAGVVNRVDYEFQWTRRFIDGFVAEPPYKKLLPRGPPSLFPSL